MTQDNRLIAISDFSLGKDTLLLTSFQGTENVSDLFEFNITVLSSNLEVPPDKIVGKSGTVTIQNEQKRKFNGYISRLEAGEIKDHNLREYHLTMVPWFWFLTRTNNHRVFQNRNTKEIVSEIFEDRGFKNAFNFKAKGGSKREYCVQHNESDFVFVSRLLEEEGIAYYFKHEDGKHTLFLVDQANAYEKCAESEVEYSKGSLNGQISRWEHVHKFRKGQWTLNDYNFEEPQKSLIVSAKSTSKFAGNGSYEHYEYPGLYDFGLGDNLVKICLDAEEATRDVVHGESDLSSFYAGGKFKLAKHALGSEKGDFILIEVAHSASDSTYLSGEEGESSYFNVFSCIPGDVHFRPARVHQRPVMRGPQSAIVVGASGEEIETDEYGRIKVQFIWDRKGKKNEDSSCFIRVAQVWAGNQWGASFIPRIGQEVIVDFMDGDPDRPIIVGSVYNGKHAIPFDSKTQSGIRTRSTKDGSPSNFNELRFDDKKDSEQIFIHAEKNFDIEVENDQTLTVDNDQTLTVEHNRTKTVNNNETSTIEKDRSKFVNKNESESISKNKTIDVGDNFTITVGKDRSIDTGKNYTASIGDNMKLTIGKDLTESVDGKHSESVTKEYGLKAKTVTIQAEKEITLKTGSAKIIMKSNGDITLNGKNINVKGSGNVVIKGSKVTQN